MASLLIVRTILGQLARQPLAWLCAALLAASWWILEVLMPLGLATGSLHRSTAHYELGFLGGALAQGIALGPCLKMRWMVHLRGPVWGLATDMAVLIAAACSMAAFILIPAEVFQLWQFAEFQTAEAAAALLLGWAHLAAMACACPLRLASQPDRNTFRDNVVGVAWIAFATVLIPASVQGITASGSATLHIFDPGRMLRASFAPGDLPDGAWLMAFVPILGWGLLGLWLGQRTTTAKAIPTEPTCATPSSETSTPI